ncbi:MAG: alpha-glucosidase, partial [Sphingomonas bacterium]
MPLKVLSVAAVLLLAPIAGQAAPAPAAPVSAVRDGVELRQGDAVLRVTALSDTILRVRIARDGRLPEDASWAVPATMRAHTIAVRGTADGFATAALLVHVTPDLQLTVTDLQGRA